MKTDSKAREQFITWWNQNWPDLAPTHQAFHAYLRGMEETRQLLRETAAIREVPALYDVAKKVCHDAGLPWTDPRTGKTYKPPK